MPAGGRYPRRGPIRGSRATWAAASFALVSAAALALSVTALAGKPATEIQQVALATTPTPAASSAAAAPAASPAAAAAATAAASSCPDVNVVFARGTGELPGLGMVGTPFANALSADLPGKTVTDYAVNYAADIAQTSAGPGATDMSNHIIAMAAQCPGTMFVIGGYSQGASVTDIAIGIQTILGAGTTISAALAARIPAVVAFGNPLRLTGQTIAAASQLYGAKADEFCNLGDPVCGNGVNIAAHLAYGTNGAAAQGAQFAASK